MKILLLLLSISSIVNAECYTVTGTTQNNSINPFNQSGEINLFLSSPDNKFSGNINGIKTLINTQETALFLLNNCNDPACADILKEKSVTGELCM